MFKPAGVPSGRGASRFGAAAPFGFCHGFRQLRPVHVFGWVVGVVSSQPRPNPALKGTRVVLWPVFPEFRPPAPLSSGVRRKRARPMGCFGIVGKIDVSPLGR